MKDSENAQVLFIMKDAVDNIARIKAASWKILAVTAASFAFFNSNLIIGNTPPCWDVAYIFFLIFLSLIICHEYPKKLKKYRARLARGYHLFSVTPKNIIPNFVNIPENDYGDKTYQVFCIIYLMFFGLSHFFINFFPAH